MMVNRLVGQQTCLLESQLNLDNSNVHRGEILLKNVPSSGGRVLPQWFFHTGPLSVYRSMIPSDGMQ